LNQIDGQLKRPGKNPVKSPFYVIDILHIIGTNMGLGGKQKEREY
jgi:hypothetical protein